MNPRGGGVVRATGDAGGVFTIQRYIWWADRPAGRHPGSIPQELGSGAVVYAGLRAASVPVLVPAHALPTCFPAIRGYDSRDGHRRSSRKTE